MGEPAVLGEITEEQFHRAFWLKRAAPCSRAEGTALINDNGSIFMTGSNAPRRPSRLEPLRGKQSRPAGLARVCSTNCATARSGVTS